MIFSAASALPSDLRMMRMISSSASKTFSNPSRMWMRFCSCCSSCSRRLGDDLEPEVQEVPEHLLQVEPLGPAGLGVLGRHEAREVDGEVGLQRRVLEQVRHDHLLVGVLLQLERDAHVVGREILHVEQMRQLAREHDVADALDQHRLVDHVGHARDVDRLLGRGRPGPASHVARSRTPPLPVR